MANKKPYSVAVPGTSNQNGGRVFPVTKATNHAKPTEMTAKAKAIWNRSSELVE
jgi:hypothetical protein